jgi:hypothetical protein
MGECLSVGVSFFVPDHPTIYHYSNHFLNYTTHPRELDFLSTRASYTTNIIPTAA